jgi:hypothetical protein
MTLCKVPVRPVSTCASETWPLTKADERSLGLFERKILRSVFGAVQWRRRYKFELYKYMMSHIWLNNIKLID